MNEEATRNLPDSRSFEERVFARFDAADARFDSIDVRLEKLESRSYDTKPIWERALKEILESRLEFGELKSKVDGIETTVDGIQTKVDGIETKVDGIETKVDGIETKVDGIETRVSGLEAEVSGMRADYATLRSELVETQREFKTQLTRRVDLVLNLLVDTRDGLRDADERLTQLESKLA